VKAGLLTFIDLFCGCGGFTLGMLRAGFRCLAAIDFNPQAVATLKANLVDRRRPGFEPPAHALERDLTRFVPAELATLLGSERVDVIVGGPPCQGFSTARQRDGSNHGTERFKEDDRRHLYRRFLDHVEFFQPQVFVIENVLGLRTAVGGRYFTAVQHEARILGRGKGLPGYRVHAQIEDATELGVPQKRRRQLIIGVRNDLPGYFPSKLRPAPRSLAGLMLGDAIMDLPALAAGAGCYETDYDFYRRRDFLSGQREALRRCYLFEVLEAQNARSLTNHVARPHSDRDLRDFARLPEGKSSAEMMRVGVEFEFPYDKSTFKDRYTRQHRYRSCSTIVAHLSKDGLMFIHPTQNRSLTPREAARVQSFPDWFVFPEARTHAFRLIGNAVPPLIAEGVGLELRTFLSDVRISTTTPTVARGSDRRDRLRPVRNDLAERTSLETPSTIPRSQADALRTLEPLLHLDRGALRQLSKGEFLRGWHALLFLFPGLHPDNALDHGEDEETVAVGHLALPGFEDILARRYTRSGWPVALAAFGREAWRRYEIGRVVEEEFYFVAAQRAGFTPTSEVGTEQSS
jgi:DNA (cytosine-5)-methyltransferase 1